MKRILFISTTNLNLTYGGALAAKAYYNSLCELYPNQVDLALAEENCTGSYSSAIKVPKRRFMDLLLTPSSL